MFSDGHLERRCLAAASVLDRRSRCWNAISVKPDRSAFPSRETDEGNFGWRCCSVSVRERGAAVAPAALPGLQPELKPSPGTSIAAPTRPAGAFKAASPPPQDR